MPSPPASKLAGWLLATLYPKCNPIRLIKKHTYCSCIVSMDAETACGPAANRLEEKTLLYLFEQRGSRVEITQNSVFKEAFLRDHYTFIQYRK